MFAPALKSTQPSIKAFLASKIILFISMERVTLYAQRASGK
jgi:hypothetical protein